MSNAFTKQEQQDWHENAERLARFVRDRMVNRIDAYGKYRSLTDRAKGTAFTVKEEVTDDLIQQHFRTTERGNLIGLHTTSPDNTCRWFVIDIDHHGEQNPEIELQNEIAAFKLFEMLLEFGPEPLLLRSNGRGGFHIWVILDSPVTAEHVYRFGNALVDDWKDLGLRERPEVFPKQPSLSNNKLGNWVRLAGLHHTHDYYSQVWDGKAWLSGKLAIDHICNSKRFSGESITNGDWKIEEIVDPVEPVVECDANPKPPIERVLARLTCVTTSGAGWVARCPSHSDDNPSLSINQGKDGRVLLHCHAGCETNDVLEAIDLTARDLFARAEETGELELRQLYPTVYNNAKPRIDLETLHKTALRTTKRKRLKQLASSLSVSVYSLADLDVAWSDRDGCWLFPERDDQRRIIGLLKRFPDATKRFISGGKRGLYLPDSFDIDKSEVIVVEGGSDTAAGLTLGLNVIGRPSAGGGVQQLAALLKPAKSPVYILGDNDPKRDGMWPGRKGAQEVAQRLQAAVRTSVFVTSIPMEFKDLRALVESTRRGK